MSQDEKLACPNVMSQLCCLIPMHGWPPAWHNLHIGSILPKCEDVISTFAISSSAQTRWPPGFDCNTYWATLTIAHFSSAKSHGCEIECPSAQFQFDFKQRLISLQVFAKFHQRPDRILVWFRLVWRLLCMKKLKLLKDILNLQHHRVIDF